jgi:sec-independent protein translocase protein TatA
MPHLGGPELIIVLVIVLMIFGAGKLPEVGSALGKGLREFKKATTDESRAEMPATASTAPSSAPPAAPPPAGPAAAPAAPPAAAPAAAPYCAKCGTQSNTDSRFCAKCGAPHPSAAA